MKKFFGIFKKKIKGQPLRKEASMIRRPAVGDRFYPADPHLLRAEIARYVTEEAEKKPAIAIMAPHAGYIYSGEIAGVAYSAVKLPGTFVILCPNHTGIGSPAAIMTEGVWRMPMGDVSVNERLAKDILSSSTLLKDDLRAHLHEHSLEVQLPFIQYFVPEPTLIPISLMTQQWGELKEIGEAVAAGAKRFGEEVMLVASSDMTHYESQEQAETKDRMAIDKILALDPRGLLETVRFNNISMCGVGPMVATLVAARELGASKAELVKYDTSGRVSGDYDQVVGYAGVIIY
ncbi:MAG: AmmeMemoRadiSam system protein B [Candidatus Aminicenantes bacterium]|nr:AmmeMemoRadiSam system protein B [Candidatus Aminicenantes bacterium]